MCMIGDSDPVTMLTEADRKARKPHKCGECGRIIERGETYHYKAFVCEGEMMDHHRCSQCAVPQQWLIDNCGGYVFGSVLEDIEEHATEYPELSEPLKRLASGMRAQWVGITPEQAPPITVAEA